MQAASIPHSFKSRLLWPMGFIGAGTASITYSNIEDSTLKLYMLQNEGTERNRTSRKVCNQAEQQARSEASSLLCRTQETTNNTQSFIESVSMMFACHADTFIACFWTCKHASYHAWVKNQHPSCSWDSFNRSGQAWPQQTALACAGLLLLPC